MICSIKNCIDPERSNGMCNTHYLRWWRHGNPHFVSKKSPKCPPIERLHINSARQQPVGNQTIGCLNFLGSGKNTYGMIQIDNKVVLAHRVAYEHAYGPIPDGMLICHHCDNTRCIEPTHLFVGTHLDNNRDMIQKGRWQPRGRSR